MIIITALFFSHRSGSPFFLVSILAFFFVGIFDEAGLYGRKSTSTENGGRAGGKKKQKQKKKKRETIKAAVYLARCEPGNISQSRIRFYQTQSIGCHKKSAESSRGFGRWWKKEEKKKRPGPSILARLSRDGYPVGAWVKRQQFKGKAKGEEKKAKPKMAKIKRKEMKSSPST